MKYIAVLTFLITLWFITALAQEIPPVTVTPEMMDRPFKDWQLNLTSLMLLTMILGRLAQAVRSSGGLKGIFAGIWGGTNSPATPTNPVNSIKP